MLGYLTTPEKLQCTTALNLPVLEHCSSKIFDWWNSCFGDDSGPKFPFGSPLGSNLGIIFTLIKPYSQSSCSVDGDTLILKVTTPIRIEIFQHRIIGISQNLSVFAVMLVSNRTSGPKPWLQNIFIADNKALFFLQIVSSLQIVVAY